MRKYFKELSKTDKEYPEQKPCIKTINAVSVEMRSLFPCCLSCIEWSNGEGFDFIFSSDKEGDIHYSFHADQIEAMMRALKELKYF